jgi:hypothetical protein
VLNVARPRLYGGRSLAHRDANEPALSRRAAQVSTDDLKLRGERGVEAVEPRGPLNTATQIAAADNIDRDVSSGGDEDGSKIESAKKVDDDACRHFNHTQCPLPARAAGASCDGAQVATFREAFCLPSFFTSACGAQARRLSLDIADERTPGVSPGPVAQSAAHPAAMDFAQGAQGAFLHVTTLRRIGFSDRLDGEADGIVESCAWWRRRSCAPPGSCEQLGRP